MPPFCPPLTTTTTNRTHDWQAAPWRGVAYYRWPARSDGTPDEPFALHADCVQGDAARGLEASAAVGLPSHRPGYAHGHHGNKIILRDNVWPLDPP